MNHEWLPPGVCEAAMDHARREFPNESCGLVVGSEYLPMINTHENPKEHFRIASEEWIKAQSHGKILAVIHSHPHGPLFPSKADMAGQMDSDVPWGIIAVDEDRVGYPIMWGDSLPIQPLIGRQFMHGVTDCYSLIRDFYRTGKAELARMDIDQNWPFDPIVLKDYPRDDCWWDGEDDFYLTKSEETGFRKIDSSDIRPGDVFLTSIRSKKLNHGGMLLSNGLIAHHLPTRFSRREAAAIWARAASMWIRYEGPNA